MGEDSWLEAAYEDRFATHDDDWYGDDIDNTCEHGVSPDEYCDICDVLEFHDDALSDFQLLDEDDFIDGQFFDGGQELRV